MSTNNLFTGLSILVSTIIAVIGWIIQKQREQEQERLKLRLQKRIEITDALLNYQHKLFLWIQNGSRPGALDNREEWIRLTVLVQIYGTKNEIEAIQSLGKETRDTTEKNLLSEITRQLVQSVRTDLGYAD